VVELVCFAFFSLLERGLRGEKLFAHRVGISTHLLVGVAMTASRGLTNWALVFLNYPTHIIFKSLKLLTVMIGSVILLRKSYAFVEYVAVGLLVASAALFSLGDLDAASAIFSSDEPAEPVSGAHQNSMMGIIIVVISLFADSLHSNTQEKALKIMKAPESEVMLFSNALGAVCTLFVTHYPMGELIPAILFCNEFPLAYILLLMRSSVVFIGVSAFVTSIKHFGVLPATTVTTVRKILSILLSFVAFPKPWMFKHGVGMLAFISSVSLSIWYMRSTSNRTVRRPL